MEIACRRLDAAIGNPKNPLAFLGLPKWKKSMDGFFHEQLDPLQEPRKATPFWGFCRFGLEVVRFVATG